MLWAIAYKNAREKYSGYATASMVVLMKIIQTKKNHL
jgi:hypothetical protein